MANGLANRTGPLSGRSKNPVVWRAASSTAESEGVGQALPLPSPLPLPLVSTNSSGGVCDSFTDRESGLCYFLSFFLSVSLITPIQLEQTERKCSQATQMANLLFLRLWHTVATRPSVGKRRRRRRRRERCTRSCGRLV